MDFEVIICTYNRPALLARLVSQILDCRPLPSRVIVVDSSDNYDHFISKNELVTYLRSSHKNQPYQRYVGYLKSKSKVLIYLDDDLEIIDSNVFKDVIECFRVRSVSGVSVGIDYEAVISSVVDSNIDSESKWFRAINFVSGVPKLKDGKIYIGGVAGKKPTAQGEVQWFTGPFMSFKRDEMEGLFDPLLLDIFEQKMGVAEDKAISMRIGLTKKLWFLPHRYFKHPPVASHYYSNVCDYFRKVTYFRLYLSRVYVQVRGVPVWVAYFHYLYFMIWRITISLARYAYKGHLHQKEILRGQVLGFRDAMINKDLRCGLIDWTKEALKDAK